MVGFTGDRDAGQEGIELAQQAWLGGSAGSRRVIIDRRGDVVEDVAAVRAPQAGRDLALAIDSRLQFLAFRELKAAVEQHKAKAGGLVVLDVATGEVLALANLPAYNPNRRDKVDRERMRNRAFTDIFEPGSTLKPFAIAAALDAGIVKPTTVVQTGSSLTIGSATIHDAHPHGPLTVEEVLQKSSNIGTARIALQLPAETMHAKLAAAGFGTPVRTGFPGEVSGRLRPAKSWKPIEQATISYGHGISTNLVQLARAYTIFATDGELKPATLLKAAGPVPGQSVLKPETARAVRRMLELATQPGGTAPKAQIVGYRVAGKTGTAHKLEGKTYANKYVSSFVGFAPASNPRIVVAVMIDEPSAGQYYGGTVAAPVFSSVTGAALRLLGVPADAPANNVILPAEGIGSAARKRERGVRPGRLRRPPRSLRASPHARAASPPTAERSRRAWPSPPIRGPAPTGERSSPTRSIAARPRSSGKRRDGGSTPRSTCPTSASRACSASSGRSPTSSTAAPRRRCGWSA